MTGGPLGGAEVGRERAPVDRRLSVGRPAREPPDAEAAVAMNVLDRSARRRAAAQGSDLLTQRLARARVADQAEVVAGDVQRAACGGMREADARCSHPGAARPERVARRLAPAPPRAGGRERCVAEPPRPWHVLRGAHHCRVRLPGRHEWRPRRRRPGPASAVAGGAGQRRHAAAGGQRLLGRADRRDEAAYGQVNQPGVFG